GDIPLDDITQARIEGKHGWREHEYTNTETPRGEKLGLGTLEKRRGFLRKFFVWASKRGMYHHDNPVSEPMATRAQINKARNHWLEFTDVDIKALFAPAFAEEMGKLSFPRFFVCQRASFMLPVFRDVAV
ncbi:hypothetical protein, partial [Azonexus sp.]|uniref:hypothetical protein n=1 Tax=Azonexus sp. TaxID=1872668 RepID=UPI00282693E5